MTIVNGDGNQLTVILPFHRGRKAESTYVVQIIIQSHLAASSAVGDRTSSVVDNHKEWMN